MSGNRISGVMNQDSISISRMAESKFRICLKNAFYQNALQPTVKFDEDGIIVWECFLWYGLELLILIHGKLNTDSHSTILSNNILSTLWHIYGLDYCYFQHDNATCHVARSTMDGYCDYGVKQLDWPSQSPDLNATENLWDESDRRIKECSNRPKSVKELTCLLQDEWKKTSPCIIQTSTERTYRRVEAVMSSDGSSTNY